MKVRPWSKPHTFQSALCMLSVDPVNIDGPPFLVKCVRKFRSTLGREVTIGVHIGVCMHAYVYMHMYLYVHVGVCLYAHALLLHSTH